MLPVTLHTATGERLPLSIKTGWHDVTVAEYIDLQGKDESEMLQCLTGLNAEQLAALDPASMRWLTERLAGFGPMPEAEPANVDRETVGQFETAKSFVRRYFQEDWTKCRVMVLPIVYGLYQAEKVNGQWNEKASMQLAEAAKAMPALDVVPFAMATLAKIEEVSRMYDELAADGISSDDVGEDELAAFGFYPALHALAGGDILKHEDVMQQSVRKVYTHLYFLQKLAERQKPETT